MVLWVWLFECVRCHELVLVCTRCLGGRRYCDPCGEQARAESLREGGRRYQQTDAGRENHRLRQKRLRDGRREGAAAPASVHGGEACAVAAEPLDAPGSQSSPGVTHQCAHESGEHGAKLLRAPEVAAYVAVQSGASGGGYEILHSRPPDADTRAEPGAHAAAAGDGEHAGPAPPAAPEARAAAAAVLARLRQPAGAQRPIVATCSCCGRVGVVVVYDGCARIFRGRAPEPAPG